MKSILVINALNGSIPLVLQKKYPSAKITCAEVFPFFKQHLTKLGFTVVDWNSVGDMKFDLVIGNPPYQKATDHSRLGSRGETSIWPEFVKKSVDLVKQDGYLSLIHPPAWRKPKERYGLWSLLTQENQMISLNMFSGKGEQDFFGIGVRADQYLVQKTPKYAQTQVIDFSRQCHNLDLEDWNWLPNYALLEIKQYLGEGTQVLYDTQYHTQKHHKDAKDKTHKFPIVHTINQQGLGIKWFDYSPKNSGVHFGQPKVLLNQNELQYPYNDYKGEYGMSQLTFGIAIDSKQEGDEIVEFLNSEKGKRLIAATKWNTFYTDYNMFHFFKKDFYKLS